jgi:predicted dehydrogenase
MTKIKVGVVGLGEIAQVVHLPILQAYFDQFEIAAICDISQELLTALGERYSVPAPHRYTDYTEMAAQSDLDAILVLNSDEYHTDSALAAIQHGKHVYSEKPIALNSEEAWKLVALAEEKGLRFGCAPITMLGEAQQTAWKAIRDGLLGTVRVAYTEVNWGRIEAWHPAPSPFYEVGPLFDVAVYPLTILTTIFGPARRVTAFSKVLYPDRVTKEGIPFHITTPDFSIAAIEFASGALARLTANFYVGFHSKQKGLEFHGDKGSLYLSNWHDFNGSVEYTDLTAFPPADNVYKPLPYVKAPYAGPAGVPGSHVEWSRGVLDMAEAMKENRPQRITAAQAAHVVDIVCAIEEASREGRRVEITSEFPQPTPLDWAR